MEDIRKKYKPEAQGLYDPRFEHDACGVGFVCDIKGRRSAQIVASALEALRRLSHRGATGADPKTGDGAGILIQLPHEFFVKVAREAQIKLPRSGDYGSGLVFLPRGEKEREFCKDIFVIVAAQEGLELLGWRKVPVDDSDIGPSAKETQPVIEQVFIAKAKGFKAADSLDLERRLYVVRKRVENMIRPVRFGSGSLFYITNLSSRTFSYKGLLMPEQLQKYFVDLADKDIKSALCLIHSRYSTNTFPTWDLSQPFRFLAHNGEINTLRGNINWMRGREALLKSELFGEKLSKIMPIVVPGGSDSAAIDNAFELLVLSGKSLAQAMTMLIPSAWEQDKLMDEDLRNFYKYQACLMEPWDGPAAIAFTDGASIGAVLDRNGLRPARYIITKQGMVAMASEVGVLDIRPQDIQISGRLEPGKIFYVDTAAGRVVRDDEIKSAIAKSKPYGAWLSKHMVDLEAVPAPKQDAKSIEDLTASLRAFGYTREDLKTIIKPMAANGQEPVGSMGNDTPHAVLSQRPQLLYAYFKQLFAQVTNPAIDPIREELVMSLETYLGRQSNLLEETPEQCVRLRVRQPILSNEELEKIRSISLNGFKAKTISLLFPANGKSNELEKLNAALDTICLQADKAIEDGYTFIILSDRGVNKEYAAIPVLLATATVHHYLVKKSLRMRIGIVVESAEPREVHHFALLFGYGADCINPYLVFAAVEELVKDGSLALDAYVALKNYIKAVDKGIMKILSKMGISTLQSYRGAQIFEAVGISSEVIERSFCGTVSRIQGAGLAVIAKETLLRHAEAFPKRPVEPVLLSTGGVYQWKKDGEFHLWNPASIAALQDACWKNDPKKYEEFAALINNQAANPTTLRSLFKFKNAKPVPIDEVESVENIVRRFATGAMSFGSISRPAHETIALALNKLGGRSNTGEGGEDPARFNPLPNGDSKRSSVKQIASGRFGVTTNYLVNADEIQIKIAQGAKPGEGGQLPGHKVSVTIARTRYTTPGVTLISPPPHHDIYSIEDLAQLIFDLKNVNPTARISVKLVSEIGVGTVAAGVAKGHADMILVSGGDGGTGASPLSSIKHAGLPWELGISETHQTLVLNNLRSRVRLQTDGQMRTGRDIAIAAMLGAEEFGFATAVLIVLGCVMLRHCNLNTCSVGIATQDEALCHRFHGKPEYIINYFCFIAEELRRIMSSLGIRTVDELVGRSDLLELNGEILPWKAKGLDLSKILFQPKTPKGVGTRCLIKQDHGIDRILDRKLITLAKKALQDKQPVMLELSIENINRTTGAMLSGQICKIYGEEGLNEDTIHVKFTGTAGQSFGAWLARGITFELEGMANDYVGKGISGGRIVIYPDRKAGYKPEENIIIGNTTFYGAISGEAYIRGVAGERFCIRNSGLLAVVEGVGDHGCEYMTGGRVVVLGPTGRNFAAGMSGGIAYVYDRDGNFSKKCNQEMVELEKIGAEDAKTIYNLIYNHFKYTGSALAGKILDNMSRDLLKFVKVIPKEYKKILESAKVEEEEGLLEVLDG